MKKQNNASLKARLLRGAFYVLLAVCAIPFARAQRNATNSSVAAKMSSLTVAAQSAAGAAQTPVWIPPAPKFPQVVLYDQYDNGGITTTLSATFNDFPGINSDCADDFVVPAGQTWNVQSIDADGAYFNGPGPANGFSVFFYTDSAGFPALQVYSASNRPWTQNGSTFTVNLPSPAILSPGTYWVEIQANILNSLSCEWGWTNRTVTSNNAAAWQNPSGFFGSCQSWGRRGATCGLDPSEPDQVYRLNGTIAGATPTPTPCSVTSPACGSLVTGPAPTDFIVNVSDPVDPATVDASDLTVNGTPANSVVITNGNTTIDFFFNTSPVVQGVNVMRTPADAFSCGPVPEFTCTFRYEAPRATPTPRPRPTPAPRPSS